MLKQPIGSEPDQAKYTTQRPQLSPELSNPEVRNLVWGGRKSTHVVEGYFVCRRLRYNSQYRGIPAGSAAITSLGAASNGVIYGGTTGEQAWVLAFNPTPPFDTVSPVVELPGETSISRSLVVLKSGDVIVGTRWRDADAPKEWKGGALYRVKGSPFWADAVQEWPRGRGEFEQLAVPVAGEGIAALAFDEGRRRLYGVTDRTGQFFYYDIDSGKLQKRGNVCPAWHHSENLLITPEGIVLTTAIGGRIVRFDPEVDKLEVLESQVPTNPGRGVYARIDSHVYEPLSGLFYIGDKADGMLYTLDPRTLQTRVIGKPSDRIRIRALAAAKDGRIFGMAGGDGDIGQMFIYDPYKAGGELRNLGIPLTAVEERRYGFEYTAACTGPQGQIYFGENEREGKLWIYFPSYMSPTQMPAKTGPQAGEESGWMP